MHISKHQINICTFLFTFILLLGMCFDLVQSDSFLSYAWLESTDDASTHSTPAIENTLRTTFQQTLYSEIVIGRQSSSCTQEQIIKRCFSNKTGRVSSFAFIFLYFLPRLLSATLVSGSYEFIPNSCRLSIIVRYIQRKDGKKSQLSF